MEAALQAVEAIVEAEGGCVYLDRDSHGFIYLAAELGEHTTRVYIPSRMTEEEEDAFCEHLRATIEMFVTNACG
jgi:hypothetical protein